MGAVLAVATVLAAGLTVLPSTVQEAQANPCGGIEVEQDIEVGDGEHVPAQSSSIDGANQDQRECNFNGPVELDED